MLLQIDAKKANELIASKSWEEFGLIITREILFQSIADGVVMDCQRDKIRDFHAEIQRLKLKLDEQTENHSKCDCTECEA